MIATTAQIDILAAHELTDLERAKMFRVVKNGRKVPINEVLRHTEKLGISKPLIAQDAIRQGITSAAPGTKERISALIQWYSCHEELSAFEDSE